MIEEVCLLRTVGDLQIASFTIYIDRNKPTRKQRKGRVMAATVLQTSVQAVKTSMMLPKSIQMAHKKIFRLMQRERMNELLSQRNTLKV